MKKYAETCNDNRFELIEKYKRKLIEHTNIETNKEEMSVIDNILFRFWQMGWLNVLERDNGCYLCNIRECGTGGMELLRDGWMIAISKDEDTKFVSLAINHEGDQINYPIGYCPNCGKEL